MPELKLAKELDFASFDNCPDWGGPDEEWTADQSAFNYSCPRNCFSEILNLMNTL